MPRGRTANLSGQGPGTGEPIQEEDRRAVADPCLVPDPEAVHLVPRAMAIRYGLVPISVEGNKIRIAAKDARDLEALDYVHLLTKKAPEVIQVPEEEIRSLIERSYGAGPERETAEELAAEAVRLAGAQGRSLGDMPIVRLFDLLLAEAVRRGATDIHLQPCEQVLQVRMRIDGVLQTAHTLPDEVTAALCARIKILAGLDIAERRIPQDGKIALTFGSRAVDLRVSTMTSVHGEAVVLRVLDHSRVMTTLQDLGFPDEDLSKLEEAMARPHGIFLVCGPTGSGKTTTLYACLRKTDKDSRCVLTLEDPVEYRLDGIRQSQIHEKIGLTFAIGLRAMLRQDPDVILVGEMRDAETVETSMRAALTGHLVLSTLHTNSALGAVTRLRDMGVEPFLLAASLSGVMAQRLARKVCAACAERTPPTESERTFLQIPSGVEVVISRAKGCDICHGSGFQGRFAISELLVIDDELRAGIATGRDESALLTLAREAGFRTLRERAISRVIAGWTTIDEVMRVVV